MGYNFHFPMVLLRKHGCLSINYKRLACIMERDLFPQPPAAVLQVKGVGASPEQNNTCGLCLQAEQQIEVQRLIDKL
jgi:hypothetical protein